MNGLSASRWSPSTTIRTWAASVNTCTSSHARHAAAGTTSTSSRRTFPALKSSRMSFASGEASLCTATDRRRASRWAGISVATCETCSVAVATTSSTCIRRSRRCFRSSRLKKRLSVIGTFHTYFDKSIGYTLGRRFFQKRLDMLASAIAVSNSTTVALNRYFEADWQIIPNGIDTDVFHPSVAPPPGITRDVPTILFLGRFDPRNGLSTLIDSFRRVKGRGKEAHAKRGSSSLATDRFASITTSKPTATKTSGSLAPFSKVVRAITPIALSTPAPPPKRRSASPSSRRWPARRPSSAPTSLASAMSSSMDAKHSWFRAAIVTLSLIHSCGCSMTKDWPFNSEPRAA